jgi:FkbM family methyltransferase
MWIWGVSYVIGIIQGQVIKYSPNWLFVPLHNLGLLQNRKIKVRRVQTGWLIQGEEKGDLHLLSPTPKFTAVKLREFENKIERFFKIEKGDVALDVGACIGDTTVPMAIKVGAEGKVIAVEPDPVNIEYLKANLSQFTNAEIIEKGIWSEKGTVEFHLHNTPTGHSIIPDKARKGLMHIEVDTLDNLFGDRKIDFAKIDVQYAEAQVLQGGDKFLRNARKLVVETHARYDEQKRTFPRVLEILERYDYQIRFTMDNGCVYAWK